MQIIKATFVATLALIALHQAAHAEKTEEGTGLAYGKDHAYFLTAPPGWILDTESGAVQGVYAVFYPKGSSWDGTAVMYSNAAGRDGKSPEAAVEHDLIQMREKSPMLKVADGGTLETKDKKQALVRYLTGDSYGNYEAAGYVVEKNIVANIILTTRNKAAYDKALPAFRSLVGSYRFVSDNPTKLDLAALVKAEQKQITKTKASTTTSPNNPLKN